MNRMKHLLCFLLVATLGSLSFKANAYTERNMLQKAADEATLKNVLVMKQAWVPYPAYTDRAVLLILDLKLLSFLLAALILKWSNNLSTCPWYCLYKRSFSLKGT